KAEQMDFVVPRHFGAIGSVNQRCIVDTARLSTFKRKRSSYKPNTVASRLVAQKILNNPIAISFAYLDLVLIVLAHQAEILRQGYQLRASRSRFADKAFGTGKIIVKARRRH